MTGRIAFLWQAHRTALLAFAFALVVLAFFAFRTLSSTLYWMDPAHRDQPLAGWMTPRYVAQSYELPPEILGPALFLAKDAPPRRISLDTIAAENGITLQALQDRIDDAAATWRASQDQPQ